MRIFLEGIDRIGKTTWAHRICETLGLAYFHPQRSVPPFDSFYERNIHNYLQAMELDDVVHDRTLISEYAYNKDRKISMLNMYRPPKDSLTIVCVATAGFINENHQGYEKEVPGAPQEPGKAALEYAHRVNHRYFLAREHLISKTNLLVHLVHVNDRELAWEDIQYLIRSYA